MSTDEYMQVCNIVSGSQGEKMYINYFALYVSYILMQQSILKSCLNIVGKDCWLVTVLRVKTSSLFGFVQKDSVMTCLRT